MDTPLDLVIEGGTVTAGTSANVWSVQVPRSELLELVHGGTLLPLLRRAHLCPVHHFRCCLARPGCRWQQAAAL